MGLQEWSVELESQDKLEVKREWAFVARWHTIVQKVNLLRLALNILVAP